jgi:hypothetical protein
MFLAEIAEADPRLTDKTAAGKVDPRAHHRHPPGPKYLQR